MSSSYSRNNTNNNTKKSVTATPFCVVCRDAGKTEKEYTSHFVKDRPGPNGKIVCPTLLNQACRICAKPGHTSSYCPEYRGRRGEERYIEREPRREERYIEREPRREERYIEREPRREERYIEREPRREEQRYSYNTLREDTERREREIQERDDTYRREEERRSKPWLQAALKPQEKPQRRVPYAYPHGPRVRLSLESSALCASKHSEKEESPQMPTIDVRKVELKHAAQWGDEDVSEPFVCDPQKMFNEFAESFKSEEDEYRFIEECDNQDEMPFNCGQ